MSTERYVVKMATGWLAENGFATKNLGGAWKMSRAEAYREAACRTPTGVALRLKPSKAAAELAKLRAEVATLEASIVEYRRDTVEAERRLDAMTEERDALARQW